MTDWLDDQEFYELCQQYRCAPLVPQCYVIDAFEALKAHIRRQIAAATLDADPEPPE